MPRVVARVVQAEDRQGGRPGSAWCNVGTTERWVTGAAGLAVAGYGFERAARGKTTAGGVLALGGGLLLLRATTGFCPVYRALSTSGLRRDWTPSTETDPKRDLSGTGGIAVRGHATIDRPVAAVYGFWRELENLPRFMAHVETVRRLDARRSHWVMRGPVGIGLEWDAEIVHQEPDRVIGWRSLDGADVVNAGSVHFKPSAGGQSTDVDVSLQYDPPGGKAGAMLARLLGADPALQLQEDLGRLKKLLEGTNT